jgi:glycosyltransferase involved in cell wall biosynthesis/peptidoglycan/xylan/chitin deacetylase (PgdA/CDA1 family)
MLSLQSTILQTRTLLTLPWRRAQVRWLASVGKAPISVLFYHRVADTVANDWTISCAAFAEHVEYCRNHFDLISLTELQQRCANMTSYRPAVSFTFDDGYSENCRFALPLLIRHRIPCTYFVTLDNIRTCAPFPHDVRAGAPLSVNTVDEVRAIADSGVEIGLHTRTHIDLSGVTSPTILRREITDAASELADLIGRPIRYFAFPYGLPAQLTPQAIQAVQDAGLVGFCSAYGAYNLPGQDTFHIRRIHGDTQWGRLQNWLTYDRAKRAGQPRIDYQLTQSIEQDEPATAEDSAKPGTRSNTPTRRWTLEPMATSSTSASFKVGSGSLPRPLRTLFVITSMPVGGAETLLVNLIDRFDRSRIAPEVVCLKQPGPLGESIAQRHILHSDLTAGKWDLRVLPRLVRLMRKQRADAVITVGAGDKMFWGRLAARLAGVPVIGSALHSTGWPDGVGRLNRLLTSITDAFIGVAEHHGQHLIERERFPASRVHVIRNGVDCQRFAPSDAAKPQLIAELALPEDSQLVGIVAALRPEKNHALFLEVAAAVCKHNSKAHFIIVGDGPEKTTIEQKIVQLGLETRVHLLGTRHDTPAIVAALDAFLLCSHNEASPVSILEALACGVPVISTNVGSVSEMVRPGETGFLVASGDAGDMAAHLKTLLADTGICTRLGAIGRQAVQQRGSLEAMVSGYTDLIESIYQQKRGKRSSLNYSNELDEPVSTKAVVTIDLGSLSSR